MAEITPPQRNEAWLKPDNTPTLRFAEVIEDIISQLNPTVSNITNIDDGISESALAVAASVRRDLDQLIATSQAQLNAKIGELEKRVKDLTNNQTLPNISIVGQLEKRLKNLEESQIIQVQDDTKVNDLITIQQTSPVAAIGELEKRVNFIEGNMHGH